MDDPAWVKSSLSRNGNCIEVAKLPNGGVVHIGHTPTARR